MSAISRLGKNLLKVSEGFTGSSTPPILTGELPIFLIGLSAILFSLFSFLFLIVFCYGSARLSYCYNKYTGVPDGTATLFAILCFVFSPVYYPYYAIFLSPICTLNKVSGGRHR